MATAATIADSRVVSSSPGEPNRRFDGKDHLNVLGTARGSRMARLMSGRLPHTLAICYLDCASRQIKIELAPQSAHAPADRMAQLDKCSYRGRG